MDYYRIHSEVLLRKLISIQHALLQRFSLIDVINKNTQFFLEQSGAYYIGVKFLKPNQIFELECQMGEDDGLLKALNHSRIQVKKVFDYIKSIDSYDIVLEDGKACRFFRFEQVECENFRRLMEGRKLLLSPMKLVDYEEWIGLVMVLLPCDAEEASSLEICGLLDMIIAPFYDKESGMLSQGCVHENHRFEVLTPREKDVAILLLHGDNKSKIAKKLSLSINTVKSHIKKIYQKYDIADHAAFINHFLKR